MSYLKKFIVKRKGKVLLTLLALLGQVVGTLMIPYLIAGIVDRGILKGDLKVVLAIGVQMIAVAVLTMISAVLGSYLSADLAAMFGRDMREQLFIKTQELSVREFDSIGVSSMVTRTTSDISNLQQTIGMLFQLVVPAPIIVVVAVVMTANISPVLAAVLVGSLLLFALLTAVVLKKSNRLSKTIQKRLDRINQVVRESITGIRVIRAFGNERYEENRSQDVFEQYADNMIRLNKLFAFMNPAVWLVMGISMAAIVWLGGLLSVGGSMNVGEITAAAEYAIMTMSYLILAVSVSVTLPKMYACLERLKEVLEMTPEISDCVEVGAGSTRRDGVITFERVSFGYHGAEEPVLRELSFSCRKGQTTAIIGGTGSGKSTVAGLLLRLHDVDSGQILLNGVDIRTISQEELREAVGYVPQKAFLFSGTIADNLRMGKKHAGEEELWESLRIAQAERFVRKLSKGLAAPVAQTGSNFSGGQKQRLAIARALVRKAQVYVFDDSFSALDLKTDAALRKELKHYAADAAKIIIAQRVSTIQDADQILVLDEGRIVGAGSHRELMKNCPVYQAIAKSQDGRKEETDEKAG